MILVQHAHNPYCTVTVTGAQYDALAAYERAIAAHFDTHGTYDGAPEPAGCVAGVVADVALPPVVVSAREAAEWAATLAADEQAESDRRDLDFSRGLVAPCAQ